LGDSKIRRLKRKGNRDKFLVYLSVLKAAYGESGYYARYNQDLVLDIAEEWEFDEEYVSNTIMDCIEIGLFSEEMFKKGILTSKGLQERYLEMCRRSRWVNYAIREEYNVIDRAEKSVAETGENVTETQQNVTESGVNVTEDPKNGRRARKRIIKDNIIEGTDVPTSVSTDSRQSDTPAESGDDGESESASAGTSAGEKEQQPPKVRVDWQKLVAFWNETTAGSFPPITCIENKRRQMAAARIAEYGKEKFIEAIRRAVQSDFLRGQNQRGFTLNFDWLIRPNNFPKVLEGNYDNSTTRTQTTINNGTGTTKQRNPKFADFGETMEAIRLGIGAGLAERGISPESGQ
jgi:hypothetical protein